MNTDIAQQEKSIKSAAIMVSAITGFVVPFMGSSINVALPSIAKEFGMDAILLSWVATAYLLSSAVFLVPFGKIADIYGRKKVLATGVAVYTIASFICAFAFAPWFLILFRIIQGVGSAMVFGTGMAILSSVIPPQERGKAIGINIGSVYLGLTMGPFIGGILTHHLGWRSLFMLMLPLGAFAFYLISSKLKGEWAGNKDEKFDLKGSLLYGISIISIMYGLPKVTTPFGGGLLTFGIIFICIFAWYEYKIPNPVLNMNLFLRNRSFAFSNTAALINYSSTYAITFLLSLYLQYVKGYTPQTAGSVLIASPILMTIVSPIVGRLADKVESRILSSLGMAITVIGLLMLFQLNQTTSVGYLTACLVVLGLGFGIFSSPNANCIMNSVEKRYYGVASATMGTMRLTGQMLSMGIASLILSLHVGHVQITQQYFPAFIAAIRSAFILFAVMNFIGIFASLTRGNSK